MAKNVFMDEMELLTARNLLLSLLMVDWMVEWLYLTAVF
jgi:hypothetical protein